MVPLITTVLPFFITPHSNRVAPPKNSHRLSLEMLRVMTPELSFSSLPPISSTMVAKVPADWLLPLTWVREEAYFSS